MDLSIALGHRQCIEGKLQALKWENKEFHNSEEANSKNARSKVQTIHFSASSYPAARQNARSGVKTHRTVLFSLERVFFIRTDWSCGTVKRTGPR